jgi:hypothetical protein
MQGIKTSENAIIELHDHLWPYYLQLKRLTDHHIYKNKVRLCHLTSLEWLSTPQQGNDRSYLRHCYPTTAGTESQDHQHRTRQTTG